MFLFRHGETLWSLSGKHTGWTDLELTERGELEAGCLGERLKGSVFDLVLSSPLKRAKKTCVLAGYEEQMKIDPALLEWNYGAYEGLTSKEILEKEPGWNIFTHNPPQGETSEEIQARADHVIETIKGLESVALFSSGHFLRAFTTRWLGLPIAYGSHLVLSTSSQSILGFEREVPAILLWNDTSHLNRLE